MSTGDGGWSDEDRAYALAWQEYERDKCPTCGQFLHESTHRENQYAYDGEVIRCHGCAAQSRVVNKFVEDGGGRAGVMFRFTRRPGDQS